MLITFTRIKSNVGKEHSHNTVFIDYFVSVVNVTSFPMNVYFLEPENKERFLGYMLVHYPAEYAQIVDEDDPYDHSTFITSVEILE